MQSKETVDAKELLRKAKEAMKNAYAPYSHFQVGAAVLTDSGEIVQGCNIENASYGATNCAERTAIFCAVAKGHQRIKAVAIYSSSKDFTPPCGICRQVMAEFMKPEDVILLGNEAGDIKMFTLSELLPESFSLHS